MSEHLERRLTSFKYHRPSRPVQAYMDSTRHAFMTLATILDADIPESREKSLAFTALEESAMWAMKALSLTDPGAKVTSP